MRYWLWRRNEDREEKEGEKERAERERGVGGKERERPERLRTAEISESKDNCGKKTIIREFENNRGVS